MKQCDVYYLSLKQDTPHRDYWDMGLIADFFDGKLWDIGVDFVTKDVSKLPKSDKAIVVIPARHHAGLEQEINTELKNIDNVVLFLTGDEEADFKVEEIQHPSIHIWVQNAHPGRHDAYHKLGTGYPPQSQKELPKHSGEKNLNVFFSGQITHKRRTQMVANMNEYELYDKNVIVNATRGFTQGYDHEEYYKHMARAKIVPCPSGAVIPDSFRVFEALESMAIPIADEVSPDNKIQTYWNWLFGEETPFPKIVGYDRLVGLIQEELGKWPHNLNKQTAWWIGWKRDFAYKVKEQLFNGGVNNE